MNDNESLSAVESLFFRWLAYRVSGKPVDAAALCRDKPHLRAALEERIAAENPVTDDAESTGAFTPKPAFEVVEDGDADPNATGAYGPGAPVGVAVAAPPVPGARAEGRFEVLAVHAEGGMGRVSVAVDTELGRRVAFKDIKPQYADDGVTKHRFTREALITGQLEHPGVIPVYGLGTDAQGRPFYAMRFVEGESLKEAVKTFHANPPKREPVGAKAVAFRGLLKRFADVCNAVAFAHSKMIVHRDLKPANVMLGPFGETLVVDWGLARSFANKRPDASTAPPAELSPEERAAGETADLAPRDRAADTLGTRTGSVMGTPAYMSPEQARGDLPTLGPAWDVYSLGATLYELLVGRSPFGGKPLHELLRDVEAGNFAPPRAAAGWVPAPLDAVVRKAMALRPEDRYASALDLAADVERYLADEPVSAHRETLRERARRWAKRHPVLVRTFAAVLLLGTPALALGLGVVYYQKERAEEAERLKEGALQREEKAHAGTRDARALVEKLLDAESRGLAQARDALDLVTDELVGKILAKQSKIGPDERAFLERLVAQYEKFAAGDAVTPEKKLLAARAALRVAQLRAKLGDDGGAARHFDTAVAALRPLAKGAEPAAPANRDLATALLGFARTAPGNRLADALSAVKDAMVLRENAARAEPNSADRLRELGESQLAAGDILSENGALQLAQPIYERYLTDLTGVTLRGLLGIKGYEQLGTVYDHLARLHLRKPAQKGTPEDQKRRADAYNVWDGATGVFHALKRDVPNEPRFVFLYAKARVAQVDLLLLDKKTEEAESVLEPLMADYRALVKAYPAVREYRQAHAAAATLRAIVMDARGNRVEVVKALEEARSALTRLAADYSEFEDYPKELLAVLRELSRAQTRIGRTSEAGRTKEEADALEASLRSDKKDRP